MRKVILAAGALTLFAAQPVQAQVPQMNFFVTSTPGADSVERGGIRGADEFCGILAYNAGWGDALEWRAYLNLPAAEGRPAVVAKDRIGSGPWYNYNAVVVAQDATELMNGLAPEQVLTESGEAPFTRSGAPAPAALLASAEPDENGRFFCFGR
jgi:hypothetical protein